MYLIVRPFQDVVNTYFLLLFKYPLESKYALVIKQILDWAQSMRADASSFSFADPLPFLLPLH